VPAQVEPFKEPRSDVGPFHRRGLVKTFFGELLRLGFEQGKELGKGRRVDVSAIRAEFLRHVDKCTTGLNIPSIIRSHNGKLVDPGKAREGRVLRELGGEGELTHCPRCRSYVARHPSGDHVPSG